MATYVVIHFHGITHSILLLNFDDSILRTNLIFGPSD